MKRPTRLRVVCNTTLAVALLLALGAGPWAQSSAGDATKPAECFDPTPHQASFVTVEPGVQVEVLDWGGSGDTMLLITGLGDNAHVWDGFAYQFTDDFHVIGITRRGFGRSDQPPGGYDVQTRVQDDLAVLDHFDVRKAVFVGHSLAASELSELGLAYPDRVHKLVYLDAYDLARRFVFPEEPPVAPYTDEDGRSLQTVLAATARFEGYRRPNAAVCNGVLFSSSGMIVDNVTPDEIVDKIFESVNRQRLVNWRQIEAPRIGIFSPYLLDNQLPWYSYLSADQQAAYDSAWPPIVAWSKDTIRRFHAHDPKSPAPVVWELPGAHHRDSIHYLHFSDEAFVVRKMREFLLGGVRD